MMPETAGDAPAGTGCGQLRDRMGPLLGQCEDLLAVLAQNPGRQDDFRRLTLFTGALRENAARLDGHLLGDALDEARRERAAAVPARVPRQRKDRHAQRGFVPRLVQESQGNGYGAPASSPRTASRA